MKPIKSVEHHEIFDVEEKNGKKIKRWIGNWDTWKFLGYSDNVEAECDTIPFEALRDDYARGETKVVRTVPEIMEGEKPRDIFYPELPQVPTRRMKILGTVLTGCEHMAADIGCTHIIGNGYYWGDYDLFESLGGKSIINFKPKPTRKPTRQEIKDRIDMWAGRPGCGGWWIDNGIRGEEPDGQPNTPDDAKKMLEDRQWFYQVVREYDPDSINRPVIEQFNMTEQGVVNGAWRSGWLGQYSENPMTCDVNFWTCYIWENIYEEQLRWYKIFPDKYMKKVQLIPQISLEHYWERDGSNSVREAYLAWEKIMVDYGLEIGGLCYYKDSIIRASEQIQSAIREVNKMIGD